MFEFLVPIFMSFDIGEMVDNLFTNLATGVLKSTFNNDSLETATSLVTLSNTVYDSLFELAGTVFTALKPLGFALITTFFLIHIYDMASREQITVESLSKVLITLIIAVGLIGNLSSVISAILQTGDSVIKTITTATSGSISESDIDAIVTKLKDEDGVLGFTMLISAGMVWLLHLIAIVMIYMGSISRALDVAWRCALAPIAAANVFEGGANSTAVKYLKSLAGAVLAGAAMLIIMQAGFTLSLSFFAAKDSASYSGMTRLIMSCAAMLSTGIAAMGASSKVKEVIS